jgi:hypothetical protein
MKSLLGAGILATALVLSSALVSANAPSAAVSAHHDISPTAGLLDNGKVANEYAFRAAMRELWEDHIVWTRQVIVSVIAGSPDASAAVDRLLGNQTDIVAGTLLSTAKSGDTAAFGAAKAEWYRNGDDIARFLASANPNWPLSALQAAMNTHLDTTLDEAVARLTGDWEGDVIAYDRVHDHILHMADTLSEGIIAQFPTAFARPK